MKKILIICISILAFSCNTDQNKKTTTHTVTPTPTKTTTNFDWLLGHWKRSNEAPGKETFERWKKISDTEYVGSSCTIQKTDTIYQEKFKLLKLNGQWNFEIQLKGEKIPSKFKMTRFNHKEFICENNLKNFPNKKLDSPNKIKYWTANDHIYASITGKKINLQFDFVKIQ